MMRGALLLENGESFAGDLPLNQPIAFGEVVFNTGMTGYVETLTDPSYAGQILVFTYPLIGNYGVTPKTTWESSRIHAKGVVMSTLVPHFSHHEAISSLKDWLHAEKVPYLTGVDTRALAIRLRNERVMPGAILPLPLSPVSFESFEKTHWVKQVSIQAPVEVGDGPYRVIAVDCGMKENIMRSLTALPLRVKRVPYDYDFSEEAFDGVFLSNGPGDPVHCEETIRILQKAALRKKPIFGICLGTQLMALAFGAKTYKLPFGHRSQNQPCLDLASQRAYLTSQNHSYAVDEKTLSPDWQVIFRNLNDGSVEGIAHRTLPFFSVQFHPESSPGPTDTLWLFKKFYDLICEHHAKHI